MGRTFGISFFLLALWFLPTTLARAPTQANPLPVKLWQQETDDWCWAACGQTVMGYLGKNVSQCEQATHSCKGKVNCCRNRNMKVCQVGDWADYDHWGFDCLFTEFKAISWKDVQQEIKDNRPFTFTWRFGGGWAHTYVAYGFKTENNVNYLYVYDPDPDNGGRRTITYAVFRDGENPDDRHWADFYQIKKKLPKKKP